MRRGLILLFGVLMLLWPALSHAGSTYDEQTPKPYDDYEDGQPLKLFSYIFAPVGYAAERYVAEPLHRQATQGRAAPWMNGDAADDPYLSPYVADKMLAPIPPYYAGAAGATGTPRASSAGRASTSSTAGLKTEVVPSSGGGQPALQH